MQTGHTRHKKGTPLPPSIKRNDKAAFFIIVLVSAVVFAAVVFLNKVTVQVKLDFDKYIFAKLNALINTFVTVLLVAALFSVREKRYRTHKKLMLWAIGFSILFLIFYICHHLFTDSTPYGGSGLPKIVYYVILITHIILAGLVLPFILFTAYRGLSADYHMHKKLARLTWPFWLYVAVSGIIVYWMISPYYGS